MKTLVATHNLQGQKPGDVCESKEGDLVWISSSVAGGLYRKAMSTRGEYYTTTFMVADIPKLTSDSLMKKIEAQAKKYGFSSTVAAHNYLYTVSVARAFPVGAVLEKDGDKIYRRDQTVSTVIQMLPWGIIRKLDNTPEMKEMNKKSSKAQEAHQTQKLVDSIAEELLDNDE